jgi:demethylmenaquinone methyltransferase/2-methoxy-6-polyprenyl-1,4-benzoquinol methylase
VPDQPVRATSINEQAQQLFVPIASNYDRWSAVLSFGQDPRWRSEMVKLLGLRPGARVLDVAAGTGLIGQLLRSDGHEVISLDISGEMIRGAHRRGIAAVLATAEALPFSDQSFDGLTFGYLMRYVTDPLETMRELARVVRPGGAIGMVEFGLPAGVWRPLWWLYTRVGLPAAGIVAGSGWTRVGRFLGPSIERFHRRYPPSTLTAVWESAGLTDIRVATRSLGGGLIMSARRL